jgi:hypothetical protein
MSITLPRKFSFNINGRAFVVGRDGSLHSDARGKYPTAAVEKHNAILAKHGTKVRKGAVAVVGKGAAKPAKTPAKAGKVAVVGKRTAKPAKAPKASAPAPAWTTAGSPDDKFGRYTRAELTAMVGKRGRKPVEFTSMVNPTVETPAAPAAPAATVETAPQA